MTSHSAAWNVLHLPDAFSIIFFGMSGKNLKYFVLPLLVSLLGGLVRARSGSDARAEALIARARKVQDAWSAGTPSVTVRTEIEILTAKGRTQGQYVVTWISSSHWTEDLELGEYNRVRVHNSEGYWQQRNLTFELEIIFQIEPMLDVTSALEIAPNQTLSRPRTKSRNAVENECTEVRWQAGTERVLCFDETTGNLLSVDYPKGENQHAPSVSRIEYSEFRPLGDKRIPFEVRAFQGPKVVVRAKILSVNPIAGDEATPVVAPPNSEFWPHCTEMQSPQLLNHILPQYPAGARSSGEEGKVIFYAVVEKDGRLSHLTLIQRATPRLELAASDAIRRWRYKPAICGGAPVRTEISIPVDFWLQE